MRAPHRGRNRNYPEHRPKRGSHTEGMTRESHGNPGFKKMPGFDEPVRIGEMMLVGGEAGHGPHLELCPISIPAIPPTVLESHGNGVNGDDHLLLDSLVPAGAGGLVFVMMCGASAAPEDVLYQPSGAGGPEHAMTSLGSISNPVEPHNLSTDTSMYAFWLASPAEADADARIVFNGGEFGFGIGAWVTESSATPTAEFAQGVGATAAVGSAGGDADLVMSAAGWRLWSLSNLSQTPIALSGQTVDWAIPHNAPTGQADLAWGGGHATGGGAQSWNLVTSASWVAVAITQAGIGGSEGSCPADVGHECSVGVDGSAARCDHVHAHGYLSTDEAHYHDAAHVEYQPTGGITATDVQGALNELASVSAPHDLDAHSDVTITSVADGDRLRYNGSEWVNSDLHWEPMVLYDGTVMLDSAGNPHMHEVSH